MPAAATEPAGGRHGAARAAIHAAVAACLVGFAAWLVLAATPTIKSSDAIKEGLAFSALSGSNTFVVLLTWGTLLAATLLTLALRRFLPATCPARRSSLLTGVKHALAWQLPPRGFWANWCGGLSAGEAGGVAGWLFINAWWLGMLTKRSLKNDESTLEQLETVAKNFGKMMAPNLMLLFLPVPHLSFVTWLTGVSRNQLIRYHRWLGHGTLWVLTIHGVLYYIYWGASHEFWVEFSDWGPKVNNLAGSLAYFFCLALWLTSLSAIRRRMYQLFFRFHIICFLGFFLFACAHYAPCWSYFAPGLLLYAADLVLRAGQLANVTTVAAASVDDRSNTVTLQLKADKALGHCAPSEVWVQLPEVSRWQWHPFTVAGGGSSLLTLHIKRYGAFTQGLVDGLRHRSITAVRLAGPNGAGEATAGCQLSPPDSWRKYDSVVMVGGGIGITGLLSMLRSMAAQHAAGGAAGLPRRVHCIWVARSAGEFSALDAPLLLAATSAKGWLELSLHLTVSRQPTGVDVSKPSPGSPPPALASTGSGSFKESADDASSVGGPSVGSGAMTAPGASPFFFNRLRPVQPQSLGAGHLAGVYLLTYLGAFAGLLLAASYASQVVQWKGGMLYAVLLSALALGLPFGLAVFPAHAFRYWRHCRAARRGGKAAEEVVPFGLCGALADSACVAGEDVVRFGDAALPVHRGRPDIPAALRCAAAGADGPVGVYAGGPRGMMASVHLTVSKLNSEARRSGGSRFELHREAVEL